MSQHGTRGLGTTFTLAALAVSIISLVSAGIAAEKPATGKAAAAGAKAALVKRGEYLVTIMGCNDCHTPGTFYGSPDFARRLSGSEIPWKGPWGVTYARNLTPDMETGIGYWSAQNIKDALRTGVKPDGKVLNPPMPWQDFALLTDPDVDAIAAYLLSLPPVPHKVPDALPPGQAFSEPAVEFPPPSAWDAPRSAPGGK